MTDKIDMSLDDIIKKNKGAKRGGGRGGRGGGAAARGGGRKVGGGGGGGAPRRGGGAPRRGGGGRGGRRTGGGGAFRSAGPRNMEGGWKHDMYDGPKRGGVLTTGGPGKLVVSNLDFGVSDSDINELFSEFGHLKTAAVHYDRSGRSLGTADVVYDRRSDAVKALKQYNGVPLDGRPMQIAMAASATEVEKALYSPPPVRQRSPKRAPERRKSGGGGRIEKRSPGKGARGGGRGGKRGGRGGGGRGGKKEPAPSAEELDKELDTYLKAR